MEAGARAKLGNAWFHTHGHTLRRAIYIATIFFLPHTQPSRDSKHSEHASTESHCKKEQICINASILLDQGTIALKKANNTPYMITVLPQKCYVMCWNTALRCWFVRIQQKWSCVGMYELMMCVHCHVEDTVDVSHGSLYLHGGSWTNILLIS